MDSDEVSSIVVSRDASTPDGNHKGKGIEGTPTPDPKGKGKARAVAGPSKLSSFETAENLEDLKHQHLSENIIAYQQDLRYCIEQLDDPDLTPQETRTIQVRKFDLAHQIRHCAHQIQVILFQPPNITPSVIPSSNKRKAAKQATPAEAKSVPSAKRIKITVAPSPSKGAFNTPGPSKANGTSAIALGSPQPDEDATPESDTEVEAQVSNTSLQRLGYWNCRLCTSEKFFNAGKGRKPSEPCKWPLKDISKMINHFLATHGEHDPHERCAELGDALEQNMGPFEYWLSHTKHLNIGDGSVVVRCVNTLKKGQLPDTLKELHNAAASFPEV